MIGADRVGGSRICKHDAGVVGRHVGSYDRTGVDGDNVSECGACKHSTMGSGATSLRVGSMGAGV